MHCYFVSDLHGKTSLYEKLFNEILNKPPEALFIGGDIMAHGYLEAGEREQDFITGYLKNNFAKLKEELKERYPHVYIILGNDDPRMHEPKLIHVEEEHQLWFYANQKILKQEDLYIIGYAWVPPTPFGLKDWEKYDVSRYVDPGCSHPFQGMRTVEPDYDTEYSNIKTDLEQFSANIDPSKSIFLFHSPPYNTALDRAGLDGKMIDYVPLDVHVGSIAMKRFIESEQPLVTLHGHIHEASSITGRWQQKIGQTYAFSAAYDKEKLALVEFDTENLESAQRKII